MCSRLLALCLTIIFPLVSLGDQPNPAYNEGLQLFQQKKFTEAKTKFEEAIQTQGVNPFVLYNLALTELELGNEGLALGLWRKALDLDPGFSRARDAILHTSEKIKIKELPHKITSSETLREKILVHFSLSNLLFFTALTFFGAGWTALSFFGRRHRFKKGEEKMPGFPSVAAVLTLFFITSTAISIFKVIDSNQPRATVVIEKVEARTGPGNEQAGLFELFEGMEVIVRELAKVDPDQMWIQVTYPGGMTGWIPNDSLIVSSGQFAGAGKLQW